MRLLQPAGWPRPKGYANGIEAQGRSIFIAGQIGWNEKGEFAPDFVGQFAQTIKNIVAVLMEASARPEHVVRLTWYITDRDAYLENAKEVGKIFRSQFGGHYPTMAVIQVVGLMEPAALVEIEATAVVSDDWLQSEVG